MVADRLKQRLTGAVALLAIGVIAWFWLLSADSPVDPVARETQIPPAPAIEPFAVPEPRQPQGIDPAPQPQPQPEPPAAEPVSAPPAQPQPAPAPAPAPDVPAPQPAPRFEQDDKGLPVTWTLQVASLSSQAAADKLMADLAAKGYKAYTRPSGKAVRVYVGPKLSRQQADEDKRAIDAAFRVNSMVVRFTPG
jgi:DedD protein